MRDEPSVTTPRPPAATRRWLALAAAAAVLAGVLYFAIDRQPAPVPQPPVAAVPEQLPPRVQPGPAAEVAAALAPEPAPLALADAPRFDVVRVAPDGAAVVAGRAAPGATVTIYADAAPLAAVEADAAGNFVAIFRAEPSEAPQALTLGAAPPGGAEVVSGEMVVLLPEAPAATAPPALPGALAEARSGAAPPPATAVEVVAPEPMPTVTAVTPEPAAADPAPPPVAASALAEDAGPGATVGEGPAATEPAADLALRATADPSPEPVAVAVAALPPDAEPPAEPGAAVPTLGAEAVAAIAGAEATPEPPAEEAAAPPTEVPEPVAGEPDAASRATTTAAGDTLGPRPRVAATAIVRADGVEVAAAAPRSARQVSLASISYADGGAVTLAGLGTAGARLRAYVDDGFAQEGVVGDDGRWSLALGDVDVGIYRLRIDQMDGAGQVASRIETPFQRDLPRPPQPRPPGSTPAERPTQVTVQPGANLWTLARVHYGAGVLYTQIFVANQHLIRDPDLIYPGQIFDLPDGEDGR